ncbi:MAG: hypothetical protein CL609_10365 [Anaerolineaceae bacterium]|nr:hypothetical protein [Anaerolineaceae bacterium]
MKKKAYLPIVLIFLGIVMLASAIVLGAQPKNTSPSSQPLAAEEETFPEIPRVSLDDALAAYKSSEAVFIDVRDSSSYAQAHVPNALSYPLAQLGNQYKELDPNAWIITYCT